MDNVYTFDNLPETSFPSNLDITQAITFGTTYKYKGLKISAGLNWHTGRPTTRPVAGQEIVDGAINYASTNASRLTDYLRVDASALYSWLLGKTEIQIGVSVWNITNENNEINNYYRVNDQQLAQEFIQNSLGLTPQALLRVYF